VKHKHNNAYHIHIIVVKQGVILAVSITKLAAADFSRKRERLFRFRLFLGFAGARWLLCVLGSTSRGTGSSSSILLLALKLVFRCFLSIEIIIYQRKIRFQDFSLKKGESKYYLF
jgi:hypothetical protein